MIIRVPVDRAECFRRRIDYDADTLELYIGREELTDEERDWIAKHLRPGVEFAPKPGFRGICPPTKEEFLGVVREYVDRPPPHDDRYEAT